MTGPDRAFSFSSGLSTSHFVDRPGSDAGAFLPGVPLERIGEAGHEGYARIVNPLDYRHAVWLNTDIGYERRRDALVFRFFVGVAALLNPSSGVHLYQPPNSQPRPGAILYAGFGVGFAPKLSSVR